MKLLLVTIVLLPSFFGMADLSGQIGGGLRITITKDSDGLIVVTPRPDTLTNSHLKQGVEIYDEINHKFLFVHNSFIGKVKIEKSDINTFLITGTTTLPNDHFTNYTGVEIIRLKFSYNDYRYSVEPDTVEKIFPAVTNEAMTAAIEEYKRLKSDSAMHVSWETMPDDNINKALALSYQLMLSILNGCQECIPIFESLPKDFEVLNFNAAWTEHRRNQLILMNYGYIAKNYNQE